jgi:hypothetical protein
MNSYDLQVKSQRQMAEELTNIDYDASDFHRLLKGYVLVSRQLRKIHASLL